MLGLLQQKIIHLLRDLYKTQRYTLTATYTGHWLRELLLGLFVENKKSTFVPEGFWNPYAGGWGCYFRHKKCAHPGLQLVTPSL